MRRLTYIEIDLEICSLVYETAPCVAELGVTGNTQCYNSFNTCQDKDNYDGGSTLTIRFGIDTGFLPTDIPCVPILKNVEYTPSRISIGENLGDRAIVKAEFIDGKDTDVLFDQYLAARGIDTYNSGSFWGKFRARFPFLHRRNIRLIQGDLGQSLAEMTTRHFKIDGFNGPTTDGKFSITGKDILKFLDGEQSLAPRISNGFLVSDITAGSGSATLSPSGIGAEYPASGLANLGGRELVGFTRSGDVITFAPRAAFNTVAVAHEAGTRVQLGINFNAASPAFMIETLVEDYADVPSSYIDFAAWQEEIDVNLAQVYTGVIADPTPVKQLVSEIIQQAGLVLWDDTQGNLRLRVLRSIANSGITLNESNVLEGTMQIEDQHDERTSRVHTYFGLINPLVSLDEKHNYRSSIETINEDTELAYGSSRIKEVFSRWIPIGGRAIASRFNDLYLSQYSMPPRKFNFSVFNGNPVELGESRIIDWKTLQDSVGNRLPTQALVTQLVPAVYGFEIEAEENLYVPVGDDLLNRVIIIDVNSSNINLRTIHDSLYPIPTAQSVIDGVNLTCYVNAGLVINSTSLFLRTFDVGTWPTGFPITLDIKAVMRSHGGTGGSGGTSGPGKHGTKGGTVLYTRHPITLDYTGATLQAGGGGGGAGLHSGGGGGQGSLGGFAGQGHSQGNDGTNGTALAPGLGGDTDGQGFNGGGNGGFYGQSGFGGNTRPGFDSFQGAGGPSGNAIDGISFCTVIGVGTATGLQVN